MKNFKEWCGLSCISPETHAIWKEMKEGWDDALGTHDLNKLVGLDNYCKGFNACQDAKIENLESLDSKIVSVIESFNSKEFEKDVSMHLLAGFKIQGSLVVTVISNSEKYYLLMTKA